jgi:hypothetical protein
MNDEGLKKLKNEKLVKQLTHQEVLGLDNSDLKKDLIQNSFWMAESDRARVANLQKAKALKAEVKPKSKMICPGDNKHKIKAKTVYPLNFPNGFVCFACSKKLAFQKIVTTRTCGHAMCKDCFKGFCKKTKACLCGVAFKPGDVIKMEETKSSFSFHNKVQAEVYKPAFAI